MSGLIKDAIIGETTSYGIDRFVYPGLILLCIILIWVGSSMWFTHFVFDKGSSDVMIRNGGVVLILGLLAARGVSFWRSSRKS